LRRCVDKIFTLRLIIENRLSHQTPLVLIFAYHKQTFDSADKRPSTKVLILNGIPDKYVKVISDMYKNGIAEFNVGNVWPAKNVENTYRNTKKLTLAFIFNQFCHDPKTFR